jgi:acyl-CoA thioester hydrolase
MLRSMSAALEQRIPVQLRWRDMDMLGHLNQSVYHELLEEGRAAVIWELILPDGTIAASGETVMVAWDPARRGKRPLTEHELAALS